MNPARKKKRLRSGFTTGACAAAAAKAATLLLLDRQKAVEVAIPFPDGSRHTFKVHQSKIVSDHSAYASIIKDAGDDPDVTNKAEIGVQIEQLHSLPKDINGFSAAENLKLLFQAGSGVGMVSKPGLAIQPGEPAINPGPRGMIAAAISEALGKLNTDKPLAFKVSVSVVDGEMLAAKTLNHRLGIIGGLSILGTTGIVRPVSAEAWTATIKASMDVAEKTGCREVVISTGRTSEKAVQKLLSLPEEAYAMMGDYLKFSLEEAKRHTFTHIHLAGMWAKILKSAMGTPQTHVRHGVLAPSEAALFIGSLANDPALGESLKDANTAREIYERLEKKKMAAISKIVCLKAKEYAEQISGLPTTVYLVDSTGKIALKV